MTEDKEESQEEKEEDEEQDEVIMFDVDGTITEEGPDNPKIKGIETLDDVLEAEGIELDGQEWSEIKEEALKNEKYYKRFVSSAQEAASARPDVKMLIYFEAMKGIAPKYAKLITDVMISGIRTGNFKVESNQGTVETMLELVRRGYKIATYSGGANALQKVMLDQIRIENATLADVVIHSAGLHDKKQFGNKMKPESYQKAQDYFNQQGLRLNGYVTDGVGEVKASAAAGVKTYHLNNDRIETGIKGAKVVNDCRQVLLDYV